jgi:hypothetical protein
MSAQFVHPEFQQLGHLAEKLSLPESDFQSLLYGLSPQQRRMFLMLVEEGTASTIEVRQRCSLGNPSFTAQELNAKLEAAGDPRRVMCDVRPHANRFSERGVLGYWRLVDTGRPPANDTTVAAA